jgi:hypothetical protein
VPTPSAVDFVAGPFLLSRESGKVAPGVLTASACLADIAPDDWAIEWCKIEHAERLRKAAVWGIGEHDLPSVIRWATDTFNAGGFLWPNLFLDAATAREFQRRFVSVPARLTQISLPRTMVDDFLALSTPPMSPKDFAPTAAPGIHQALARRLPANADGDDRGFDILGFDGAAGFDSFRCNGLEADFERVLGVRFNQWGLVDDVEQAHRCADLANGPDVATCAVAWHPWRVVEHAL